MDFPPKRRDKMLERANAILDSKRVKLMALYKTSKDLADYAEKAAFEEEDIPGHIAHSKLRALVTARRRDWKEEGVPHGGKKKGKSRKSSKSSKTRKNRKTRSRK
jgi:hypothetical protein